MSGVPREKANGVARSVRRRRPRIWLRWGRGIQERCAASVAENWADIVSFYLMVVRDAIDRVVSSVKSRP